MPLEEIESTENDLKSLGLFGVLIIGLFVSCVSIPVLISLDYSNPCTNNQDSVTCNNWKQNKPLEYRQYLNRVIKNDKFNVTVKKNKWKIKTQ